MLPFNPYREKLLQMKEKFLLTFSLKKTILLIVFILVEAIFMRYIFWRLFFDGTTKEEFTLSAYFDWWIGHTSLMAALSDV